MRGFFIGKNQGLNGRLLSALVVSLFLLWHPVAGYAQTGAAKGTDPTPMPLAYLPDPGAMLSLTPAYSPALVKGLTVFPDNPFKFDFIIDLGDSQLEGAALRRESNRLIKYFLTTLTIPESDLWVNLSPYEKDKIIPQEFGITEMGRDLLAQDYVLKQLTASLLYPEEQLGKEFWDRVYKKAQEVYGTIEIPVNTFNKVWVLPQEAEVYTTGNSAFVVQSYLKVMIEEDYLALRENIDNGGLSTERLNARDVKQLNNISSEIVEKVILPEIEREVNEGKNFEVLRQIYHSMILATWFKQNLRDSLLNKEYIGQNKIAGIDVDDKKIKERIYQEYLTAFKKGVYDYIREDYDASRARLIPRRYFSGGMQFWGNDLGGVFRGTDNRERGRIVREELSPNIIVASAETKPDGEALPELTRRTDIPLQDEAREIAVGSTAVDLFDADASIKHNMQAPVKSRFVRKDDFKHIGYFPITEITVNADNIHIEEMEQLYVTDLGFSDLDQLNEQVEAAFRLRREIIRNKEVRDSPSILAKELTIELSQTFSNLGGDDYQNSRVVIQPDALKEMSPWARRIAVQVILSHEILGHEAGFDDEDVLTEEDIQLTLRLLEQADYVIGDYLFELSRILEGESSYFDALKRLYDQFEIQETQLPLEGVESWYAEGSRENGYDPFGGKGIETIPYYSEGKDAEESQFRSIRSFLERIRRIEKKHGWPTGTVVMFGGAVRNLLTKKYEFVNRQDVDILIRADNRKGPSVKKVMQVLKEEFNQEESNLQGNKFIGQWRGGLVDLIGSYSLKHNKVNWSESLPTDFFVPMSFMWIDSSGHLTDSSGGIADLLIRKQYRFASHGFFQRFANRTRFSLRSFKNRWVRRLSIHKYRFKQFPKYVKVFLRSLRYKIRNFNGFHFSGRRLNVFKSDYRNKLNLSEVMRAVRFKFENGLSVSQKDEKAVEEFFKNKKNRKKRFRYFWEKILFVGKYQAMLESGQSVESIVEAWKDFMASRSFMTFGGRVSFFEDMLDRILDEERREFRIINLTSFAKGDIIHYLEKVFKNASTVEEEHEIKEYLEEIGFISEVARVINIDLDEVIKKAKGNDYNKTKMLGIENVMGINSVTVKVSSPLKIEQNNRVPAKGQKGVEPLNAQDEPLGGIDLDSKHLKINERGNGGQGALNLTPNFQNLENLTIKRGLTPVINEINFLPVFEFPFLLGLE